MSSVAVIGRVESIADIPSADFISSATVSCGSSGKWSGTVKKGEFHAGDFAEVYLQDALLPQTDEFAFMEKYGWIVKMKRFKGVPSECLILPMTLNMTKYGLPGTDISEVRGVEKYSKPLPANMAGEVYGNFPTHLIPKTDEPNFQTAPEMVEYLRGKKFYSTVKADGSSATIYHYQEHFGCCSRNLELKDTPNNAIWHIARKYNLQDRLPDGYAVQFETVGPGIQSNPMGLKEVDARVFNLYDINGREYFSANGVMEFCEKEHIPMVDIVDWDKVFDFQIDEDVRHYAEGIYPNGKQREGVVIRPMIEAKLNGDRVSVKVINLLYK